ncbi:MAG: universal stress protein [Methylovirgula sp.]
MLKRILVLLGETQSSCSARQYAMHLAKHMDVELAGLAGVDLSGIEISMPGVAGSIGFMAKLEEELRTEAEESRTRLHEIFQRECETNGVPFEWLSFEGDPISALYLATEVRDLLITGHDTAFRSDFEGPMSKVLAKLLSMTPRPVMVCGDELSTSGDVLIAYDGSLPAMRAVQIFALLGIGRGHRIHATSIDASSELAVRRASGAVRYLRAHGYDVEACPLPSRVHPAEVLRIEIMDRNIGTLVMGAYGHRGFRELLFGSTTSELVENPPCTLFVYH